MNTIPRLTLVALLVAAPAVAQTWEAQPIAAVSLEPGIGFIVADAGDLDGDGVRDGLVSSITAAGGRGRVHAISSATGATLFSVTGQTPGDELGHSADGVGDVDGDGTPDLVIGSPVQSGARPGRVSVHSGVDGTEIWSRDGEANGDVFGWMVAGVGDVNGDGIPDVVAGAPGHDTPAAGAGKAYVLSGSDGSVIREWTGAQAGDGLGSAVGSAGDRDADGRGEVIVCAVRGGSSNQGEAFVYSGMDGALALTMTSPPAGNQYGNYFAGNAGDVNADGVDDPYVIDYLHVAQRGRLYVYSGVDGALIHSIRGPAGNRFLFGRVRIGDLDFDGHDDLLLCSGQNGDGGTAAGAVYLYSGRTAESLGQLTGDTPGLALGTDCVAVGDADGDGSPDIFAGFGDDGTGNGGALVLPTSPAPPRVFCSSLPTSTGSIATLGYAQSLSLSSGTFQLSLASAPATALSVAFGGPVPAQLPAGNGIRCVGSPLARWSTFSTDAAGAGLVTPTLPVGGAAAVSAGMTLHVQVWFRDAAAGGSGFNLSEGLRLTFRP